MLPHYHAMPHQCPSEQTCSTGGMYCADAHPVRVTAGCEALILMVERLHHVSANVRGMLREWAARAKHQARGVIHSIGMDSGSCDYHASGDASRDVASSVATTAGAVTGDVASGCVAGCAAGSSAAGDELSEEKMLTLLHELNSVLRADGETNSALSNTCSCLSELIYSLCQLMPLITAPSRRGGALWCDAVAEKRGRVCRRSSARLVR